MHRITMCGLREFGEVGSLSDAMLVILSLTASNLRFLSSEESCATCDLDQKRLHNFNSSTDSSVVKSK